MMLGFYLKAAWRNAARTPLHSVLNLLGLSLGLAAFILAMLLTDDELHYNAYYDNHADLYMIRMGSNQYGEHAVTTPEPASSVALLKLDFPGIDNVARFVGTNTDIARGETLVTDANTLTVDPTYIETVGIPLLRGDQHGALLEPDSVAIDQSLAMTMFGTLDCLGQTIQLDERDTVRVAAVFRDMPMKMVGHPRLLRSGAGENSALSQIDKLDSSRELPPRYIASYLLIRSPEARARIEAGLEDFGHRHFQYFIDNLKAYFILMPLDAWRLQGKKYGDQDSHPLIRFIAINAVGFLVLAVATLNYVNLATALAGRRGVEIGVRKAIGASRGQVIAHILAESVALSFVATLVATALVEISLPVFNALWYTELGFDYLHDPGLLALLAGFALVFGLLAGAYPALVLSRGNPAGALREARLAQGTGRLRQALVLLQYAVSIGMIIGAGVIDRQYHYAANDIDGIDNSLIYDVRPPPRAGTMPGVMVSDFAARMADLASAVPEVTGVAGIARDASGWVYRRPSGRANVGAMIQHNAIGPLFFDVVGVRPLVGRLFDRDHADPASIVISLAASRALGFSSPEAAVGDELVAEVEDGSKEPRRFTVIGVTPDFLVETLYGQIPPRVFVISPPSSYAEILIKLSGRDVPATVAAIEKAYRGLVGRRAFRGAFLDYYLNMRYLDMLRDAETIGGFSLLAIFVAALGLFSLAEFMAERRTKEIGIRKAMGASSPQIAGLLARDFLWPALAANLLAWPLAYFGATWWLHGFTYHVEVALWLLPAASALVLAVAGLTVLLQVIRVARARPVTALRYE